MHLHKILFSIFFVSSLFAQRNELGETTQPKLPLYILLSEPTNNSLTLKNAESFSEWLASAKNNIEISPKENLFTPPSDEMQRLKRWAVRGALVGASIGLISGIIEVYSIRYKSQAPDFGGIGITLASIMIPVLYSISGGFIGGVSGAAAYLILEYPWSEPAQEQNE